MSKLDGRVALVTGAGRGIGRAIALKLATEGARLVVNDIDADVAHAVASEIGSTHCIACPGDVCAVDFGNQFVSTAMARFGGIDIIVNNAGYSWDGVIHKMADEQFDVMLDVHLKAPFRILRAAAGPIRELVAADAALGRRVHRKVVNISSIAGTHGNAGQANYSAAKAGLVGLTLTLAKEWGRLNVNVNCVAYGLIQTRLTGATSASDENVAIADRMVKVGLPQILIDRIIETAPLRRAGTVEEAAGAAYLLCIPESDYITGHVLLASGGFVF